MGSLPEEGAGSICLRSFTTHRWHWLQRSILLLSSQQWQWVSSLFPYNVHCMCTLMHCVSMFYHEQILLKMPVGSWRKRRVLHQTLLRGAMESMKFWNSSLLLAYQPREGQAVKQSPITKFHSKTRPSPLWVCNVTLRQTLPQLVHVWNWWTVIRKSQTFHNNFACYCRVYVPKSS